MVEELEYEIPRAPRMTLGEVVDAAATWALMGTVLALWWLSETLVRRGERRRGR